MNDINLDRRKTNIMNSPKNGGSSMDDSISYLRELNIEIKNWEQPIQFNDNNEQIVHRWTQYIQGFSASFVQNIFDKYRHDYEDPYILDPFAGSGTVLVQAKLNGYRSFGNELNPWMQMVGNTKLNSWIISSNKLIEAYKAIRTDLRSKAPEFLESEKQFNPDVLDKLEILKGGIKDLENNNLYDKEIINLLKVAFSSILIDCSNLKRSPCLGYAKKKIIEPDAPYTLFRKKVSEIAEDLDKLSYLYFQYKNTESQIALSNSKSYIHDKKYDLVITSPPYMNGMDYAINYKIEMSWLDFVKNHKELKDIKDDMVVCDNVSKGLIKDFSEDKSTFSNDWLDEITDNITKSINKRGTYRRMDMPYIVRKYFDDMYKVMKNVYESMNKNGRFILVVGDSLIADVYLPTDLLLAKIGLEVGFKLESIEKARDRRSGQIRSYLLRETIVTLIK